MICGRACTAGSLLQCILQVQGWQRWGNMFLRATEAPPHPPPPTFQCFPKLRRVGCPQNSGGTMAAHLPSAGNTGSAPYRRLIRSSSFSHGEQAET